MRDSVWIWIAGPVFCITGIFVAEQLAERAAGMRSAAAAAPEREPAATFAKGFAVQSGPLADNGESVTMRTAAMTSTDASDLPDTGMPLGNHGDFPEILAAGTPPVGGNFSNVRNGADAQDIGRIVRQFAPDASEHTIEVWSDTCRGMSIEDVTFLMQQRSELGMRLPQSLTGSPPDHPRGTPSAATTAASTAASVTAPDAGPTDVRSLDAVTALEAAEASIRRNLLLSSSPGFRREVFVLNAGTATVPNPRSDSDVRLADHRVLRSADGRRMPGTGPAAAVEARFPRSFEPGRLMASTDGLHVALPGDPELMFCFLDGSVLSRRGDFRLLSDRRMGVATPAGDVPLCDVPRIPEDVTDIAITASGRIIGRAVDVSEVELGQVPVVRCPGIRDAETTDGVFFRINGRHLQRLSPEAIRLRTGTIEMSNVDRHGEWQELEHIRRLLSETAPASQRP